MRAIWRMHILPDGGEGGVDYQGSFQLCLDKNIIGIGWGVTEAFTEVPLSTDEYREAATRVHSDMNWTTNLQHLLNMQQHDLVWIRGPQPYRYHICRIVGPWDYRDSSEYRQVDIHNVRPVEMVEVKTDIPATLPNFFMTHAAINPVVNPDMVAKTIALWNRLHA